MAKAHKNYYKNVKLKKIKKIKIKQIHNHKSTEKKPKKEEQPKLNENEWENILINCFNKMSILEEEEFNPIEEIETTNIIDININVSFIDLIKKRK